jgi:LPXTG-motif cell wall-anchored protein
MNDILKTYMERFRENRHTLRRYTAFVLALAMITTLFVNWQLHGVGISMTAQYQCGEEEHTHTADCYTKVLTCGYEEGELENADEVAAAAATSQPTVEAEPAPLALEPQIEFVPHEHTEDCYTEVQTLTCMEEEHVHGDDCFDPEDGSLICDKFEHTHDESCYTTEYELTCGLEEGELVEQVVEPTQSAELAAMAVAEPVALEPTVDTVEPIYHHHTDACYEEVLTCPLPEHHHTVACLSDTSADLETPEEWQAANAEAVMTGNWDEDLLSVAKTQLGYEQSEKNFEIDPADGVTLRYYSRYGQSYGNSYGEWDVMFLSYCLKYAGIPQSAIPQEASVLALRSSMSDMDWLLDGEDGSAANVGDIVIYNKYVTRTVAVDSSADGAADDLDDQFSMDTDFENGAELETSGAAALDAAPAAEDAPTADSVITPDLPDTANPEQPAAKPVDSTGTSASGADALIPSVVSPAAEPQTTTVTDAQPVETVGIVSETDENTLTVISGDVDGKVAEVTLSNAEVLAVVDVAAAQYADEMLSSAVDGALQASGMLTLAGEGPDTLTSVKYVDFFDETKGTQNGGITGITVKKGTETLTPGKPIELKDGDKLHLTYYFNIPERALSHLTSKTLTYRLPEGIQLDEEKRFPLTDNNTDKQVGTGVIQTDGTVKLNFNEDYNIEMSFTGQFDFQAEASATGSEESSKIHFPTNLDLVVKLPRDLKIKKEGATPVVENGITYIKYTITVSSEDGWSQPIEILDELQNNDTIAGEYDQKSFTLVKNNDETPVTSYTNQFTTSTDGKPTFHITNLGALKAGEKYKLTYRVKITKNNATGDGSIEFLNKARSNDTGWKTVKTKFEARISKDGSYNADTDKITWTVTVKNPYGQNLKGSKVEDTVTTPGATIVGNVTLTQTSTSEGGWSNQLITNSITPYEDKTRFEYTFGDADGKEYQFTYVTSAPKDTDGKFLKVHNDSTITIDGKKYTAGKDVTPSDRKWNFHKNPTGSFTSTGENQYTAGWSLSSDVPNSWTEYTFVDQIKKPTYGEHYGIALELDKAIRESLRFTTVDKQSLTAEQAGITVEIDYYADSFSEASQAKAHSKTNATDNTTEIHTFIIHLTKGPYTGTFPVRSMNISSYYTHVDTTKVPAGAEFYIYNNDAWYHYKKNTDKTSLTKGVSINNSGTHPDYGSRSSNYQPTATGNYKSGMEVYYELVLDISSWDKFPEEGTVTVTDTLPDGLTFKEGSAKGFFGWGNWCQQNSSDTGFTFGIKQNFEVTRKGQTITFKFKNLNDKNAQHEIVDKDDAHRATHLLVRYAATVTDDKWENPKTVTETYTNTAKWGDIEAKATITLNRELEYLTKSAKAEALNDKGKLVVHYSLNINPAGTDLLEGSNTVTLTDKLAVQAKNVTAHLDMDSVKLYDYPYVKGTSQPLLTTSYGMVYERTTDSSTGYDTHTMTFTLDDSHGYVLKYDYVLDSNDEVKLSNEAVLAGIHHAEKKTTTKTLGASGSVSSSMFTLYKVDSLNSSTRLQGAKFNLSYYDGTKYVDHEGQHEHTTDEKGEIVLYLGDNVKDDHSGDHFSIEPDKLYKLVETQAPDGYKMGTEAETTVYVIFAKTGESATDTWKATAKPDGLQQSDSNVVIVTGGQQKNYDVKNTRTWLTIQKFWQDKDGKAISGDKAPESEVTVHLRRYSKTGGSKEHPDPNFDKPIILSKENKWTFVYKDVNDDFFYYIEEASTGGKYDVTYSDSNTTGVEKGGLLTLTNKEIVGYELPSTGGTGTLPYTAVGGTMMLSALAYSFIHRKRRHEGRADD